MLVFLDTNILGSLSNPNASPKAVQCQIWFERLLARGGYFVSSELCFYEAKRSLVLGVKRGVNSQGLEKLIALRDLVDFIPVTPSVADLVAEIWAEARLQGIPTADAENLDIDMFIAAHWRLLQEEFPGRYVVVSTTNIKHLSRFTEAKEWREIRY